MQNKFPLWKNLLILFVVLLGAIYSAPNLYPDDPAVQITHESEPIDEFVMATATDALRAGERERCPDADRSDRSLR